MWVGEPTHPTWKLALGPVGREIPAVISSRSSSGAAHSLGSVGWIKQATPVWTDVNWMSFVNFGAVAHHDYSACGPTVLDSLSQMSSLAALPAACCSTEVSPVRWSQEPDCSGPLKYLAWLMQTRGCVALAGEPAGPWRAGDRDRRHCAAGDNPALLPRHRVLQSSAVRWTSQLINLVRLLRRLSIPQAGM